MSIESDLRKDGIRVIRKLDTLKVNSIAKNVSFGICNTFPYLCLNENDLFIKISRINMYIASMPEGMSEANYFYKNSSIYFNEHIPYDDLESFAVHECIHFLQEVKDKKNYLLRMGLCDYTEFKIYGLGLNEAAVQLMTSKVLATPKEYVKYFNISFETNSPTYYPIECCLVNQLSYIVGEDVLFESTLNSNDNFKQKLSNLIGAKNFTKIQDAIDTILLYEEKIVKLNNKIVQIDDRNKKVDTMIEKINNLKKDITSVFMKTQNLIISSSFDAEYAKISTIQEIENYRRRLYNFKDYIGATEGYMYFNDYYVNKMMQLEDKYNYIENHQSNAVYIVKRNPTRLSIIFNTIRKLVFNKNYKTELNMEYSKDK